MPVKKRDQLISRRHAIATMAGGASLMAAPALLRAQTPLKVSFVQQRGLLYLPVDMMVSGGVLQQEATLAQTRATLPPLQKQLAQTRDQLKALAGRFPSQEPSEIFDLAKNLKELDAPVLSVEYQKAATTTAEKRFALAGYRAAEQVSAALR